MMIPLKAELRIAYKPVVTYAIVLICIIIYFFQANSNKELYKSAAAYCSSINKFQTEVNELDFLRSYPYQCVDRLTSYYGLTNKKYISHFFQEDYKSVSPYFKEYRQFGYQDALAILDNHIDKFSEHAPINLDGALVYDPSTLNPLTMVTSVLSHGSFLHIFFNLVFFLAFAPALEALVGNSWRFLGVIGLMILGTNLVYALSMLSASYPTPTLGLSGIVMGMMGFAVSFMPKARIKTFYYVVVLPTPVWLLSIYYIGWDIYELYSRTDHGGVNVVVHVAGGIIGVLMMLLFRKRQKEIGDQLHDEIEFMQNKRTTLADSTKTKTEIASEELQEKTKKQEVDFLNELYRLARVGNHSAVINIILRDYDPAHAVVERYEFLFNQIQQWQTGRAFECVGRLVIDHRLNQHHTGGALRIAIELLKEKNEMLLANPEHVLLLANASKEVNNFELAYALVKNAKERYWGKCEGEAYILLEMELLHLHLNKTPEALTLLKSIFDNREHPHRNAAIMYAKKVGIIGSAS
jgi:membrane associated rhomboid family serine protease